MTNGVTTNGGVTTNRDSYESSGDETPPPPPEFTREVSPPPLPPPCSMGTTPPTSNSTYMLLTKPSLPEPEGPPPPPPIQNGYAFNTPHMPPEVRNPLGNLTGSNSSGGLSNNSTGSSNNGIMKKPKEPIYESIKPRPEPLGGPAEDDPGMEYGFTMASQPRPANGRPPLPQVPGRNNNQTGNGIYGGKSPLELEREARRMNRVRRELERIQVCDHKCSRSQSYLTLFVFIIRFLQLSKRVLSDEKN